VVVFAFALAPSIGLGLQIWSATENSPWHWRVLSLSLISAFGYFLFGFSLILIVSFIRVFFRLNLKEGVYPLASASTLQWMMSSSLHFVVSVVFMDFILLTPFAAFFYWLMGAKLGRNVQINTKFNSDLSLLEIGDNTVIGGHATVICHSFENNQLILKKVIIGKNVVVGLNSIILPGCQIGDGATIAAAAVLPKDTYVAPRTTYFGPS
jgi:hypothetical protein